MLTYNQLIKISRSFQQAHHVLNNFGNGGEWDRVVHNQQPAYKYPLMWMDDLSDSLSENLETYSFRIAFMAPVVTLKERDTDLMSTNANEVKSDMIQCANDFIAYWVNQTDDYPGLVLDKTVSRTKFEDVTDDKLAGCYIDITFRQNFDYNECSIPMGTPTSLPDTCAPVLIYEDGVLVQTVASGGSYSYTSGGGTASQTFNGGAVTDQDSGTTKVITVKDSGGNNVGTKGTDTALALDITIDDVTVDNSDVSYTVDIPAEGVFVLPDVTVTINGASQGSFPSVKDLSFDASNIIYIRPANSGYGTTSYLTGDEGYNETNYPAPSAPAFGVPAYLDPTNPKMLLNNNVFGHKHRFTGVNGGYYDYNTSQYKLADGTVSDQATTFGTTAANTSYLIDHHTGLGWKWNIQGVGTWSAKVSEGLGLTHASFSDWFLPSRYQYRSLYCIFNLGTNLISLVPFNSINSCKTSTPTFGSETTAHHQINGAATTLSRADSINDAAYFCRWHF